MLLEDKVALITGADSSLGEATAKLLAKEGAKVAALGSTESALNDIVNQIRADGGTAINITADVSRAQELRQAIDEIDQAWGNLDAVFANAEISGKRAPLEDLMPEEWDRVLNVNLTGTFLTVKHALPLLKRHGGSIVIKASTDGTRVFANPGATAYACSKAAQVTLAKMAAAELAPYRVRVNVICPGEVKTPLEDRIPNGGLETVTQPITFPEGKIPVAEREPALPEEIAQAVLFLISDQSSHISGTEVWIDGAQSLMAG